MNGGGLPVAFGGLASDKQPCGYVDCLAGELAWCGVEARGYMFIHCVSIYSPVSVSKKAAAASPSATARIS